jgi:hypothetical protein
LTGVPRFIGEEGKLMEARPGKPDGGA